jgi:hypothetical protein
MCVCVCVRERERERERYDHSEYVLQPMDASIMNDHT